MLLNCSTLTVGTTAQSKEWVIEFNATIPSAAQWLITKIVELTGKTVYVEGTKIVVVM